jgi:hypothetical protein
MLLKTKNKSVVHVKNTAEQGIHLNPANNTTGFPCQTLFEIFPQKLFNSSCANLDKPAYVGDRESSEQCVEAIILRGKPRGENDISPS